MFMEWKSLPLGEENFNLLDKSVLALIKYHVLDIISKDANLYAEIPVLNGYAPPPVSVMGFSHS